MPRAEDVLVAVREWVEKAENDLKTAARPFALRVTFEDGHAKFFGQRRAPAGNAEGAPPGQSVIPSQRKPHPTRFWRFALGL